MQDPSAAPTPQLRRAWLSGYRVGDVEVLFAQFGFRVSQLWSEVQSLKERLSTAESERATIEARLREAQTREIDLAGTLPALLAARDEVAAAARQEARAIVETAEGDAARIRGEAQADTDAIRGQVEELLRLRESLSSTLRTVVRDFTSLAGRIELSQPATHALPAAPVPTFAPARQPEAATPAVPEPGSATSVFDGRVELDAGPFTDFASLSAFERALGSLPKIQDVYIRRFEGERATIDVELHEPVSLIDDMTSRLPYRFAVDHSDLDHIALTVSAVG